MTPGVSEPAVWAALVPELMVRDLVASLAFYRDALGFAIRFERPEDGFAYLALGRAEIMLERIPDDPAAGWRTGTLEPPLGRGMNLQIEVGDVRALRDRVVARGLALFRPLATAWYREGEIENGQAEFLVQDPDGYLLRFVQPLGERPAGGP